MVALVFLIFQSIAESSNEPVVQNSSSFSIFQNFCSFGSPDMMKRVYKWWVSKSQNKVIIITLMIITIRTDRDRSAFQHRECRWLLCTGSWWSWTRASTRTCSCRGSFESDGHDSWPQLVYVGDVADHGNDGRWWCSWWRWWRWWWWW